MKMEEVANLSNRRKINATMLPVRNALHWLLSETRRAKILPLIRNAVRVYVTLDTPRSSTFDCCSAKGFVKTLIPSVAQKCCRVPRGRSTVEFRGAAPVKVPSETNSCPGVDTS